MQSILTIIGRILLAVLGLVLSLGAAGLVFYSLSGMINKLPVLLAMSVLALLLVSGGTIWLLTQRWWVTGLVSGGWLVATAVLFTLLFPAVNVTYRQPTPLPNMQFWDLPTGSHVAYTHVPAVGQAQPTPIIFLHGGPGWLILDSDITFYSQLAQDGYDVYLYDQIGSGRSARLEDVRQYTTARHVADLEAIRQALGAAQIILIGQSWGNTLAADYMAAYPNNVARVIFSSPGAMWDVGRFKADYSGTANVASSAPLPPLRVLLSVVLASRNPLIAQQVMSQQALESYFNAQPASQGSSQNYCLGDEDKVPVRADLGANQYVNRIVFASQESYPDPRPALRQNQTPALILRGACEFLPAAVAQEYRDVLPQSQLVEIANAGHALYGAQPEMVLALMRAFLADSPLPLAAR